MRGVSHPSPWAHSLPAQRKALRIDDAINKQFQPDSEAHA